MNYRPGDAVIVEFVTSAASGAATTADSLPTGTLNRNGTDDGAVTVTVTLIDAGRYKAAFTIPDTYLLADELNLTVAATVGAVAGKGAVWHAILQGPGVARYSKATAGGAATVTLDAAASAVDSFYVGLVAFIYGGTGAGQARRITGYVGSTKVATGERNWVTNPAAGSLVALLAHPGAAVDDSLRVTPLGGQATAAGYLGDYPTSGVPEFLFNTRKATGAAATLGGLISHTVQRDGNSVAVADGVTVTPDYNGVTGAHLVSIAFGSADAGFYAAGHDYTVLVTGTVDGVQISGMVVAEFSIRNRDLATASALPAAVWAYGTRTLTSFGTLVADAAAAVWAYAARTLTQSAASVQATMTGSALSLRRGDTWSASLTGLGSLTGRQKLWFTAKRRREDADSAAAVQLTESGDLIILNGSATIVGAGTLTVTDATTGAVTLTLTAAATAVLRAFSGGVYDLQWKDGSGTITTLTEAEFSVTADVTQAVS